MFAIRQARRSGISALRARGNATLQTPETVDHSSTPAPPLVQAVEAESSTKPAASNANEALEDDEPKKRKGPYKFWPTTRPSISLERPREYNRPIGVGVLPAYDEALAYIKRDSSRLSAELTHCKTQLEAAEKEGNASEVERLKEKVKILEVQSEINLPSVRWKARNGLADMSKPVYRHLLEQRWREEGDLDLLMERIHQMNVVPDMLPSLHPSFDLRLNFPEPPPEDIRLRTRVKRKYEKVEPGVYLLPEQTRKPPMMYATVFHTDTRLYTLLMVDLDVPDPENETFQSYLHWMHPNIPLSSSTTAITLQGTHTKYIPPHPQKGTPYHRYVMLLVPQTGEQPIEVPHFSESDRLGFDYRDFAATYGLDASQGGGAHMWREVWDETVTKIYQDVLKTEEPVFGRMPKVDYYKEMKKVKKYI
ncbi:PEBP-like protein [Cristinia sonorae]|uniref:PEBP-like protein n=1 Tax=Cristinia sonorae TaxID=1940300 RepID=A0A8K0XQQ8_9AGAR|nr:PEBP-like protein [Cristinia sonorae]